MLFSLSNGGRLPIPYLYLPPHRQKLFICLPGKFLSRPNARIIVIFFFLCRVWRRLQIGAVR
jgi:hypothetical protein